ncbi:FHA domain-containing protein [Candidatus Skiveiella danica]|uniref:FHA domain-containing protein n=1 Tax=Candidatus Skiveiella danica TaxID=3386177 RepID=UPI001D6DD530|nr:FHA domain-containing protein [Betaproteobacteria bacterium]
MAELVVSSDGVETQHVHLMKDRTTLGRRHHNDVALSDLSVSGMHCVFERGDSGAIWLMDVGSTNGTYVNGERIQRRQLEDQDVVTVGIYSIRFLLQPPVAVAGQTSPMRLEALGAPGRAGAQKASLRVLEGVAQGRDVPLVKTVTTFGKPGDAVVAVYHRRHGYYVALVEAGEQPALHNGQPIGTDAAPLADQDILELGDSRLLFILG